MNLQNKVSTLMTKTIHTLSPEDKLQAAKDLFDTYSFHHIPILKNSRLVGIVSKSDYLYFLHQLDKDSHEPYINKLRLKNYTIEEVMMKNLITVSSNDTLQKALEILSDNRFHALPVVDEDELNGILTTHDIIFALLHPSKVIS